jgi:hypothetical protein
MARVSLWCFEIMCLVPGTPCAGCIGIAGNPCNYLFHICLRRTASQYIDNFVFEYRDPANADEVLAIPMGNIYARAVIETGLRDAE